MCSLAIAPASATLVNGYYNCNTGAKQADLFDNSSAIGTPVLDDENTGEVNESNPSPNLRARPENT
jgi:hypothetical protein